MEDAKQMQAARQVNPAGVLAQVNVDEGDDFVIHELAPSVSPSRGFAPASAKRPGLVQVTLLNTTEAAYQLHRKLGPLRAWTHLLADMRRGRKSAVEGHQLMPAATMREGDTDHPMYSIGDVADFIRALRAHGLGQPQGARVLKATIDLSEPDWRKRIASAPAS